MDSKILALLSIGVAAIVIIAIIIVYQFAQEQYAISKIQQKIKENIKQAEEREIEATQRSIEEAEREIEATQRSIEEAERNKAFEICMEDKDPLRGMDAETVLDMDKKALYDEKFKKAFDYCQSLYKN
jgi:uncharacterized protein HemX